MKIVVSIFIFISIGLDAYADSLFEDMEFSNLGSLLVSSEEDKALTTTFQLYRCQWDLDQLKNPIVDHSCRYLKDFPFNQEIDLKPGPYIVVLRSTRHGGGIPINFEFTHVYKRQQSRIFTQSVSLSPDYGVVDRVKIAPDVRVLEGKQKMAFLIKKLHRGIWKMGKKCSRLLKSKSQKMTAKCISRLEPPWQSLNAPLAQLEEVFFPGHYQIKIESRDSLNHRHLAEGSLEVTTSF